MSKRVNFVKWKEKRKNSKPRNLFPLSGVAVICLLLLEPLVADRCDDDTNFERHFRQFRVCTYRSRSLTKCGWLLCRNTFSDLFHWHKMTATTLFFIMLMTKSACAAITTLCWCWMVVMVVYCNIKSDVRGNSL